MTLKDITWYEGNGLEELLPCIIDPTVALTEAIYREFDDSGDQPRPVVVLSKMVRQYLGDLTDSPGRL